MKHSQINQKIKYWVSQELKEILGRALTTKTTQVPDSLVQYDYATSSFIPIRTPDNVVVVFEMKGTYIHKDTAEAKAQMLEQGIDRSYNCKT